MMLYCQWRSPFMRTTLVSLFSMSQSRKAWPSYQKPLRLAWLSPLRMRSGPMMGLGETMMRKSASLARSVCLSQAFCSEPQNYGFFRGRRACVVGGAEFAVFEEPELDAAAPAEGAVGLFAHRKDGAEDLGTFFGGEPVHVELAVALGFGEFGFGAAFLRGVDPDALHVRVAVVEAEVVIVFEEIAADVFVVILHGREAEHLLVGLPGFGHVAGVALAVVIDIVAVGDDEVGLSRPAMGR